MSYKNISGTTMPTFKLRNGRLELISAILTQEDGSKIDQFKIRDSKGNIICLCGSEVYKEIMNISKEKLDDFF